MKRDFLTPMRTIWLSWALIGASSAFGASARLGDLDLLQRSYVDVAPSYSPEARVRARSMLDELRRSAPTMNDAEFFFALARVVALSDNGHDSIDLGEGSWFPKLRLPVRFIWFRDALLVARAAPEHADLLGAQVLRIEDMSPDELLERLHTVQGGVNEYLRWQLNWIIHTTESLHALRVAKRADRIQLQLKLPSGELTTRTLLARPASQMPPGAKPERYWLPAPLPGELAKRWRTAVDAAKAPLYLQDSDNTFRMRELPEHRSLYVQFRSNFDADDDKIAPFVAAVAQRLKDAPANNLILDLRFDTGGDNTQNRELMRMIAARVPGKIYLLVGNYTFSAGIASAAALKHDGGDRVMIVGDAMADRTYWWSERAPELCLPESKLCLFQHTGYWDVVNGCRSEVRCYSDQFDLAVRSLAPDLLAPLTSRDWLANEDPGMEAVIADLAQQR